MSRENEILLSCRGYAHNHPQAQVFFFDDNRKFIASGSLKEFLNCSIPWPANTSYMSCK